VDLSALIFVALAVAWAVYLIPKALRHHEEDAARRSVDSFSDRMRVLARREAVSASRAELVVGSRTAKVEADATDATDATQAEAAEVEEAVVEAVEESVEVVEEVAVGSEEVVERETAERPARAPLPVRLRRAAAARAARRRRRVLGTLLLITLAVVGLAAASVVAWPYVGVPVAFVAAWLVACRLMVRKEHAAAPARRRRRTLADAVIAEEDAAAEVVDEADDETSETAAVEASGEPDPTPGGWDPVPVTLPTYVTKAPAGRTVRTIDLDSTGVWSSGRNAADSRLAREAEATSRDAGATAEQGESRRASGA